MGEQQSFRSGRTFEDADAGTLAEEITLDYEIAPVAGFPVGRLNLHYRGLVAGGAGQFATLSREQARAILDGWGF
ncbi:MAG: hypothetical protein EON57_00645 [Alphaproteobacteria bacterium]|nr:MAG: hypothetical protein EON57_00645 [Alphaproteobacteria bacterium]